MLARGAVCVWFWKELLVFGSEKKNCDSLTKALNLEKPCIVKANLDRPNIFLHKEKRKAASSGAGSYDSILYPIAKDLKTKLADYLLTLIYLLLNWCGYAFKLFLDILGDASYFPINAEIILENLLFGQFHAPQNLANETADAKAVKMQI